MAASERRARPAGWRISPILPRSRKSDVSPGSARKLVSGLALGAASASVVLFLANLTPAGALVDTAELKSYDWRIRQS
jgi:hypothetical protein